MSKYLIYYNYETKDSDIDLVIKAEKKTMEVEADTRKSIDTSMIRERIRQIANDDCSSPTEHVIHANYYKIEEIKED